ncbi:MULTISPECIES: hypothetical protein [Shewanella]|uniref:Lipoprotein n=1 Tax=Shewanella marisflavi TaxID=260364 RepID=A0ABX5WU34_9GAMM|nr:MULTISPECIES: hypothetical protein [Shewanella]QDF76059.1 hypothetical protein FGA12_13400 [Shewanella marisflavi]
MNHLSLKKFLPLLAATALFTGCASTSEPYQPQSKKDFVYNDDMSFAMNVIDGSLGFHNGLRDATRPENSDTSPTSLDYAADGIIGAAFGGGLGGAFLSMLGTNQGNKPLHTYYGIVYYPISQGADVQGVFDAIEKELITAAVTTRDLTFIGKSFEEGKTTLTFNGHQCELDRTIVGLSKNKTCNFIHYVPPKLLRYATVTPHGETGHFAVIGYERFYTGTSLSLDLDKKYYVFGPAFRARTKFPYVSNSQKIYPFIKPSSKSGQVTSFSIEQIMNIDPWINKSYGASK